MPPALPETSDEEMTDSVMASQSLSDATETPGGEREVEEDGVGVDARKGAPVIGAG